MGKVFEGLKVVDLTTALNGPFCTMFLGDYGADVKNRAGWRRTVSFLGTDR